MKLTLFLAAGLLGFGFTGCSTSPRASVAVVYQQPTPQKTKRYQAMMGKIASGIQHDPKYQRIVLNTPEKKAWFKGLTYRLWDRQITRAQFIAEGLSKYPTHRYEFEFVANGFQQH